jgi:hypothetical protein
MDRPGVVLRWLVVNFLVMFLAGLLMALLDLQWGRLEQRWGLTVWFSFLVGFSAVAVFNVLLGLLGLGYRERRGATPELER